MKKLIATGTLTGILAMGSFGCVAQQEVDDLRTLNRQQEEQIIELQAELEEAESRIAALRERAGQDQALQDELDRLRAERDELSQALADAEQQLRDADFPAALPEQLDSELQRLAEMNPDLMEYDPDRGMIRFASDLTFELGSAEVRDEARRSLQRLADILNSDEAAPYEVRVVGHTDDVPIERPATLQNHPTNWHLSVHRAIAVKDVLEETNVSADRMNVSGYAYHRPLVPHQDGGTEENRRVEIYLVAMTGQTPDAARNRGGNADEAPAAYK